jgi:hypothetical protein
MGMQTGSAHPGDRNFTVILRQTELQDGFVVELEKPTGCADPGLLVGGRNSRQWMLESELSV